MWHIKNQMTVLNLIKLVWHHKNQHVWGLKSKANLTEFVGITEPATAHRWKFTGNARSEGGSASVAHPLYEELYETVHIKLTKKKQSYENVFGQSKGLAYRLYILILAPPMLFKPCRVVLSANSWHLSLRLESLAIVEMFAEMSL